MADNIQLDAGAGGDILAADDVGGAKHQRVKVEFGADGTVTEVSAANPLPVDNEPVESLQSSTGNTTATAAGGSDDVDSTQINSAKTGQLLQMIVTSSVFFKVELKTVQNAVESAVLHTEIGSPLMPVKYTPSHKTLRTIAQDAGAGFDGFRATVTNLDVAEAADIYVTFEWDEV